MLTPFVNDFKQESLRRLNLLTLARDNLELQQLLALRWKRDPIAFISDCIWTFDPRDNTGWKHRPFVPWGSQGLTILMLAGLGANALDYNNKVRPVLLRKSRDEGGTIIIAAIALWDWLFNQGDHGLMCRAGYQLDGGGYNSLFGKLDYSIKYLPIWLVPWRSQEIHRRRHPPQLINPDSGAVILGSTTTEGGWRGARMNYIWVDEAAWIPNMDSILTSIFGACDTPVLISSVAGKGNTFYKVDVGEGYTTTDAGVGTEGWMRTELHYRANPSKSNEWIKNKKASMTKTQWAQEYECDYSASAPGRIWPEYDSRKHVLNKSEWGQVLTRIGDADLPLYEGWDYGISALTAVVWASYDSISDTLYIIDSASWRECRIDEIAKEVGVLGWSCVFNPQGIMPDKRLGDPAGKTRDSMLTSPFINLKSYGISVSGYRLPSGEAIRALIRLKISENKILLSPRCSVRRNPKLPSISECIEQYRKEGDDPKPKKDDFSHAADALQYICSSIWQGSQGLSMGETF